VSGEFTSAARSASSGQQPTRSSGSATSTGGDAAEREFGVG
jgi:hypothetical protein